MGFLPTWIRMVAFLLLAVSAAAQTPAAPPAGGKADQPAPGSQRGPTPLSVLGPETPRILSVSEAARGQSALARGLPSKALFHLDHAVSLAPRNPLYHALRGEALASLDHHAQAVEAYSAALDAAEKLPPDLREQLPRDLWATGMARSLLRLGRYADAEAALDRAESLGARPDEIVLERAWARIGSDPAGAAAAAQGLLDAGDASPQVRLVLAEARHRDGDDSGALEAVKGLQTPEAYSLRAEALGSLGREEEADEAGRNAERLARERASARTALFEGVRAMESGDLDASARSLARAREGLGDDKTVAAFRGLLERRRGDLDRAQAELLHALSLDPGNPVALEGLGDLAMERGRISEALLYRQAALRRDPDAYDLYMKLGASYSWLGRLNDAMTAYLRARDKAPEDPLAYLALAALHDALGRPRVSRVLTRQAQLLTAAALPPQTGGQNPGEEDKREGEGEEKKGKGDAPPAS